MINIFKKTGAWFLYAALLLLLGSSCNNQGNKQANEKLMKDYYTSYEKKDSLLLCSILDAGFTFGSPVDVPNIDLKTYLRRCWPNAYNTKKFDIEKMLVDGDEGFVTYNGYTNAGKQFCNTEYFKFKDGKIIENVCYFGPGISFPNNTAK